MGHGPEGVDESVGHVGENVLDRRYLSLVRQAHLRRSLPRGIRSKQIMNGTKPARICRTASQLKERTCVANDGLGQMIIKKTLMGNGHGNG